MIHYCQILLLNITTTALQPFIWGYPGEPVPEETHPPMPILINNHPKHKTG